MKKIFYFLILMSIPFYVKAESCSKDSLSIESISVEEKSDNTKLIDDTLIEENNIKLNLSMSKIGDSIKYKILIRNNSNEDYELENDLQNTSEYIEYTLESEDNLNLIKANTTKAIYLKAEYKNEIPLEKFDSGIFKDNEEMHINISFEGKEELVEKTEDKSINENPKTGIQSYLLLLFLTLAISIMGYLLLKNKSHYFLIFLTFVIIPLSINAICKSEITITANINIEKKVFNILDGDVNSLLPGDRIGIGNEEFYVISSENDTDTVLLAKYNLKAGSVYDKDLNKINEYTPMDDSYGIQSEEYGGVKYSAKNDLLNGYKDYLVSNFKLPDESIVRLIKIDELRKLGCNSNFVNWPGGDTCKEAPGWLTNTSYWTQSLYSNTGPSRFCVWTTSITAYNVNKDYYFGVRPVLVIKTSDIKNNYN